MQRYPCRSVTEKNLPVRRAESLLQIMSAQFAMEQEEDEETHKSSVCESRHALLVDTLPVRMW